MTKRPSTRFVAGVIALLVSLTTVVGIQTPTASAAVSRTEVGDLYIEKLNMTRKIYRAKDQTLENNMALMKDCIGAIDLFRSGPTWLAAHRTDCGRRGFGGIERLQNGDRASITRDGMVVWYELYATTEGQYYGNPVYLPDDDLVLQASKSEGDGDTRLWLKHFRMVSQGRGYKLQNGQTICPEVTGASANEWAFINVTLANGQGEGYVTAYQSGSRRPSTSTANWQGSAAAPNTTVVQVGQDNRICVYAGGYGSVDVILDTQAIGPSSNFVAKNQRLIDTRNTRRPVTNGKTCFNVPGAANRFVALNVTAIGQGDGYGAIIDPKYDTPWYSNVNFMPGIVDANMTIAKVPYSGQLCYYSWTTSHVVIDFVAQANSGVFRDIEPDRFKDRSTSKSAKVRRASAYDWVLVNATPIPRDGGFWGVLYGDTWPQGDGSDINWDRRADPNTALVRIGRYKSVRVKVERTNPEWIFDSLAYSSSSNFRSPSERRFFDSRSK